LNDVSNYEQPVSLRVHAKAPHLWRDEGGTLSLRVTPRERLGALYASLPRRRLDLDLGAVAALEERHEIVLPPGFEVKSAPPSAKLSGPFGELSVEVVQEPGKVIVDGKVSLRVSRVSPDRYAEFRKFCQAADAAFEPRLVLGARAK
jgi:cellulose synthase operon protein C